MNKCNLPWTHLVVLTNGKCYNCCYQDPELSFGDINQNEIDDIWNGEKIQKIREEWINGIIPDVCKTGIGNCMHLGRK